MTFDIIVYIILEQHECDLYKIDAGKYRIEHFNKQKAAKTERSIHAVEIN